jgi:hypothetical protein
MSLPLTRKSTANGSATGVNNQWPWPTLNANVGDNVVVNLHNLLGNETAGIHWHGQSQIGTGTMDGPSGVTQCSIPPGASFTYNFTVWRRCLDLYPKQRILILIYNYRLARPDLTGITRTIRASILMAFVER